MTAKEYLNRTYRIDELIKSNLRELDRLRGMIGSLGSPGADGAPGSPNVGNASYTRLVEKIVLLEEKINTQIDEMVSVQAEVGAVINAVENRDERLLLRLRYIEHCSWRKIAKEMKYSEMQCYRVHEKALENVKIPEDVSKC